MRFVCYPMHLFIASDGRLVGSVSFGVQFVRKYIDKSLSHRLKTGAGACLHKTITLPLLQDMGVLVGMKSVDDDDPGRSHWAW